MSTGARQPHKRPPGPVHFHLLMHIGRILEDRCREQLAEVGLHHGQARVVMTLHRRGPQLQADLARGMDVAPPTMSIMLRKLLAQKLVRRTSVEGDERVYKISLTAEGERAAGLIGRVWNEADRVIRAAVKDWGAEAEADLHDMLLNVRNALGGRGPKL